MLELLVLVLVVFARQNIVNNNATQQSPSHPGEQTCKYHNGAKEKARDIGDEASWRLYLDVDTLEALQVVEEAKSGGGGQNKGVDVKATVPSRMDSLTTQLQVFISAQWANNQ